LSINFLSDVEVLCHDRPFSSLEDLILVLHLPDVNFHSIIQRRPRSVELGAILLKKADDRAYEVRGGLRFANKADANAKNQAPQAIAELNLDTVNQSYRYVPTHCHPFHLSNVVSNSRMIDQVSRLSS
jgi:hypothetical protein